MVFGPCLIIDGPRTLLFFPPRVSNNTLRRHAKLQSCLFESVTSAGPFGYKMNNRKLNLY